MNFLVPTNALTAKVGFSTNFAGNPTVRELARRCQGMATNPNLRKCFPKYRRNSGGNAIAGYDGTKVYTIGQTPASVAASMTSGWELDS